MVNGVIGLVGFVIEKGLFLAISTVMLVGAAVGYGLYGVGKLAFVGGRAATKVAVSGFRKLGKDVDSPEHSQTAEQEADLTVSELVARNDEALRKEATDVGSVEHDDDQAPSVENRHAAIDDVGSDDPAAAVLDDETERTAEQLMPKILVSCPCGAPLVDEMAKLMSDHDVIDAESVAWWQHPCVDENDQPIMLDDDQRLGMAMHMAEKHGFAAVVLPEETWKETTVRTPKFPVFTYGGIEANVDIPTLARDLGARIANGSGSEPVLGPRLVTTNAISHNNGEQAIER